MQEKLSVSHGSERKVVPSFRYLLLERALIQMEKSASPQRS